MAAGRGVVHSRLAHLPQPVALVHDCLDLADALDRYDGQVLYVDSLLRVLLQVELGARILAEQVAKLFVVDLDVGAPHEEALLGVRLIVDAAVDVFERVRDDPVLLLGRQAHHRVRLSAPGLAVGKDRAVVATEDRLNEGEGRLIVDGSLSRIGPVHRIVSE